LGKFGGPWNRKCCYMYFMTFWNILRPLCIICSLLVWVVCAHLVYFFRFGMFGPKNLATLLQTHVLPETIHFDKLGIL
jgi:hypothetical protein